MTMKLCQILSGAFLPVHILMISKIENILENSRICIYHCPNSKLYFPHTLLTSHL